MADRATDPKLRKALIEVLDRTGAPLDPPVEIPVRFYPTEYQQTKALRYGDQPRPGRTAPLTQFVGGDPETLSMELVFDTSEKDSDVRTEYLDAFDRLLQIDDDEGAPPVCRITWGNLDFTGVLASAEKRFTLFRPDGLPVRARANVTFRRFEPPTASSGESSPPAAEQTKTRVVTEGDTLWAIAGDEYGDPTRWRTIADANGIENPRTLQIGTELVIPPAGGA